jgi:transforming growth factor-beta-induced protein
LEETLSSPDGVFTLFAPSDEAIDALPPGALEAVLSDVEELTDTLLFHVVSGQKLYAADLPCEAGNNLIEMANGKNTRSLCVDNSPMYIKGVANNRNDTLPELVVVDVEACNGVVHVIDYVLLDDSFL